MNSKHNEDSRGRNDNPSQFRTASQSPQHKVLKQSEAVRPSTSFACPQKRLVKSKSYQHRKIPLQTQQKILVMDEPHSLEESLIVSDKLGDGATTPGSPGWTQPRNDSMMQQKSYSQSNQKQPMYPENKMYKITLGDHVKGEDAMIELYVPKKVKVMKFTDYRTYCKSIGRVKSASKTHANNAEDQNINKGKEQQQQHTGQAAGYTEYFPRSTVSKSLNLNRRAQLYRTRQQQMYNELQRVQPLRPEEVMRLSKMQTAITEIDQRANNFILPSVKSDFTKQIAQKAHEEYMRFRQSLKEYSKPQSVTPVANSAQSQKGSKADSGTLVQKIIEEEGWNRAKTQQSSPFHRGSSSGRISGGVTPVSFIIRHPGGDQRGFKDYLRNDDDGRVLRSSMQSACDEERADEINPEVKNKLSSLLSEEFTPQRPGHRKANSVSVQSYLKQLSYKRQTPSFGVERAQL